MKIIAAHAFNESDKALNNADHLTEKTSNIPQVLAPANCTDPRDLDLRGVARVDLHFPKATDGRAFSQAVLLRRRLGFGGSIRATGEVLVDQLQQMQRCGFSEAVLSFGQDAAVGERLLRHYPERTGGFYQGDAAAAPRFAPAAAPRSPHTEAA